MNARAWRRTSGAFELDPIAITPATPADDRVVVEVEAAAIDPFSATPVGRVPGVAAVGRVVATGAATTEWSGARVLVPSHAPCGECERCRRGGAVLCAAGATHGLDGPGTLATTVTAAARWLCRLEAPLDLPGPAVAALGGELALAYALYARAGIGPREPVVVWGAGALARACAAILAAKGAPAVLAHDDPAAVEAALRDAGDRPRKLLVADGAHLPLALQAAGLRATIVVASDPGRALPEAAATGVLRGEATLVGVAGCHPDLVPELVALAVRGDLDLGALVEVCAVDELPARLAARATAPAATSLVATVA